MTIQERIHLSDDISSARAALEKARYMHQEIADRFFSLDPATSEGAFRLHYTFPRYAAFFDILGDLLANMAAILPTSQWIDSLQAIAAKEVERA